MAAECQDCEETVNANYTLHTGILTVCLDSDGIVRDLGNVKGFDFQNAPEFLEHFNGATGALDFIMPLRRAFSFNAILDELTPSNLAMFVGGQAVANLPSGCAIELAGVGTDCSFATGAVSFLHRIGCGTKTVEIIFDRAMIAAEESSLSFGEEFLEIPIAVRALLCNGTYGRIIFSEECPAS